MSDPAPDDRPDHPAARVLFGWVDAKSTPGLFLVGVAALAVLLFVIDLFTDRHEYFHFAEGLGFYGFWGFCAFALAVLSGWPLGALLRRSEDYYGEADTRPADVDDAVAADVQRGAGE